MADGPDHALPRRPGRAGPTEIGGTGTGNEPDSTPLNPKMPQWSLRRAISVDSMLLDAAAAATFPVDNPFNGQVLAMASARGSLH